MKILLSLFIGISTLIFSGIIMASEHNTYFFFYKAHQIPCTARINGIFLLDSYDYEAGAPDRLSMGFDISQFVNIAANEITIQADNASPFIQPEKIEQAYCIPSHRVMRHISSMIIPSRPIKMMTVRLTHINWS